MKHVITDRLFPSDPASLLVEETPDNQPYWDGLRQGELRAQQCTACARLRFPTAPVCPHCSATGCSWKTLSGRGKVFSWVRFDRSYLPQFEDLMPYVVLTVELDESVRMYGRLVDRDVDPAIGAPVMLAIERWPDGTCVAAFMLGS